MFLLFCSVLLHFGSMGSMNTTPPKMAYMSCFVSFLTSNYCDAARESVRSLTLVTLISNPRLQPSTLFGPRPTRAYQGGTVTPEQLTVLLLSTRTGSLLPCTECCGHLRARSRAALSLLPPGNALLPARRWVRWCVRWAPGLATAAGTCCH